MTFCVGIVHDGPVPQLTLGDGTKIVASPENINRAVAAYVRRCYAQGIDPAPIPRWFYDDHREKKHIAVTQPSAPLYRYTTLCGLTLRSGPTQTMLPADAMLAAILHQPKCGNCARIAQARRMMVG